MCQGPSLLWVVIPPQLEALVRLGADVNAADENGDTARDYANNNGHTNIAERIHEL